MQRLGVSGAVRPIYGSLGVKRLSNLSLMYLIPVSPRYLPQYPTLKYPPVVFLHQCERQ